MLNHSTPCEAVLEFRRFLPNKKSSRSIHHSPKVIADKHRCSLLCQQTSAIEEIKITLKELKSSRVVVPVAVVVAMQPTTSRPGIQYLIKIFYPIGQLFDTLSHQNINLSKLVTFVLNNLEREVLCG